MNRIARVTTLTVASCAVVLGGAGAAAAHAPDAAAKGAALGSPGILSGNNVQIPISIPTNICGNTVNAPGLLNPALGNVCVNR